MYSRTRAYSWCFLYLNLISIEAMRMVMTLCEGAPGEGLAKLFFYWPMEVMVFMVTHVLNTGGRSIADLAKLLLPLILFIQRDKIQ